MRKPGTILTPECKEYAKDIEQLTNVPEYINLQYLRLIESLLCQRISEQVLDSRKEDKHVYEETIIELPLIGKLTIIPKLWHHSHLRTGKPSIHYEFTFEPFPAFKSHINKIYSGEDCELVSLLSDAYSKILVDTYKNIMEENED